MKVQLRGEILFHYQKVSEKKHFARGQKMHKQSTLFIQKIRSISNKAIKTINPELHVIALASANPLLVDFFFSLLFPFLAINGTS